MNEPTAAAPATTANTVKSDAAPAVSSKTEGATAPVTKVDDNGVAAEQPKKIWKLNVNGKEVEYDASDESKLKNDIQKVFGIEEKARTTAEKVENADKLVTLLTTDYKGFVKQCKTSGIDPQKLATDILYEQIRLNSLSPEQRELEEYKEREAEAAAKAKATEEAAKVAETTKKTQDWAQKFEKDCQEALAANKLPKTRLSLALIAQYVDAGLKDDKEYSVSDVLPYVARDLKEIHVSTMGKLEGDELLDYVGEAISNKIAKARVERYKKSQAVTEPAKKPATNSTPSDKVDLSKLKGKAYWAAMRKMKSEAGVGMFPGRE